MDNLTDTTGQQSISEFTFLDFAEIVAENLRLLTVGPILAALIALAVTYFISPTYTATTRILPPSQQQSASAAVAAQLGSLAGIIGGSAGVKNPIDQYVALLRSTSVFDAIIARFELRELYSERYIEDTRKELAKRTTISGSAKDGLITISVNDRDPTRAAKMANAFVEELSNLSKNLAISEAAQRRLFFESQLTKAKTDLLHAETVLRNSGVSEATLRTMPQSALEALARLKAQITTQEIRLASMRLFMTDEHPDFRLATQELVALKQQLAAAERSHPVSRTTDGKEYIARYRDFKYQEALLELMAKQYELARLDEAREGAIVQVVDIATPPERQATPRRGLIVGIVAAVSLALLAILAFLRKMYTYALAGPDSRDRILRIVSLVTTVRSKNAN
jgi:uncharacterized protein involved in exopolysaccharide biosynthesis